MEKVFVRLLLTFSPSREQMPRTFLGVVVVQNNRCHASKHLLEVLLQFGDILTVDNVLKQVYITDKVEPAYMGIIKHKIIKIAFKISFRILCWGGNFSPT